MQNTLPSIRITSLHGSQPSSVVFGCKTASFGPEIQVSMCPTPHLSFCASKIAWFAPEWQVYMGSSPHLLFGACKQRLYNQNYMTLWVPDLAAGFVNAKQRSSTRMTTLYGFQPFTCGFGHKTAWFAPEWQDYIASSHHLWFCACKTAPLGLELQVSVGQRPHLCFFMQNSDFMTRLTSVLGFQPSPVVLCMQSSDFSTWIASLYGSQPSPVVFAGKTVTSGPE